MTKHAAFIAEGLKTAREALADAVAMANLHLKPETLTRSLKRRCMTRLRAIETILRRLIFLMALSMDLAPLRVRRPDAASLPDGVEDVTVSFGPQPRGLRIAPGLAGAPPGPIVGAHSVQAGPVNAAPVIARCIALYQVLKAPERHAKRLARAIARWKARGEARPYVLPQGGRHRLRADLGLVAGLLPNLLNEVLQDWNDSS